MSSIDPDRWREAFRPLDGLLERAQSSRFRLPEEERETEQLLAFSRGLAGLLEEAVELLGVIQTVYEAVEPEPESGDDSLLGIAQLISTEVAGQEVLDVLFLARAELRGARHELQAGLRSREWSRLASGADNGLRALKKSLIAVESSLYEYEGVEPPQRVWADLEVSLAVRRLYARLRRDLLWPREPIGPALAERVDTAIRRFRALRDSDIYPLLRFDDRQSFARLRDRMEEWSLGDRDPGEGRRIWQDLTGFLELLKEVNHRQELRQHDRGRLRQAYRRLVEPSAPSAPPPSLREELEPLIGLDADLDEILLSSEATQPEEWRATLWRLLGNLSGIPGSGAPPIA